MKEDIIPTSRTHFYSLHRVTGELKRLRYRGPYITNSSRQKKIYKNHTHVYYRVYVYNT